MRDAQDPSSLTRSDSAAPVWMPVLLIFLGLAAYADGLTGPFIFDDYDAIIRNTHIRQLWPPRQVLSSPPLTSVSGRPVVSLTLALNYALGGLSVFGYHLLNVAIHISGGLVLFAVVRRTLQSPALRNVFFRSAPYLAATVTAIWLVHPLQTEAVTYVIQRTELMAGFFYLLTIYFAIRGWEAAEPGGWYAASAIACGLGMGCKEVMVSAPLMVFLYDGIFVSPSWRDALRRHGRLYAGLALAWLILFYLVTKGSRSASAGWDLQISPRDYLLTQAGVIVHYLRLCFWPTPLVISYDDWPIAHRVVDVLPQAIVIVALLALTVVALWRRWPAGFLGAWFFLILAPSSSVVPIVTEVAAERRMYLPLAAVLTVVVVVAGRLAFIWRPVRILMTVMVVLGVGLLGATTMARNRDYRSDESIWGDLARKRPGIAFAHFEYANALAGTGKLDQAMAHYEWALKLRPDYPEVHTNYGDVLADRGRIAEAIIHYREALRLDPTFPEAHNNFGTVLASQRHFDEAIEHFRQALKSRPGWAAALSNLGDTLIKTGRVEEGIGRLREAVASDPNNTQIRLVLADALAERGMHAESIEMCRAALQIDPTSKRARERLDAELEKSPGRPP